MWHFHLSLRNHNYSQYVKKKKKKRKEADIVEGKEGGLKIYV